MHNINFYHVTGGDSYLIWMLVYLQRFLCFIIYSFNKKNKIQAILNLDFV